MAVDYSQFQQQLMFGMSSAIAGDVNQAAAVFPQALVPTPQVFSEPMSELTCNISGSRKRTRKEQQLMQPTTATSAMLMYQQQQHQQLLLQKQYQQQLLLQNQIQQCKTHHDVPVDSSRLNQSIMTSTSGRPTTAEHLSSIILPVNGSMINNNNNTASTGILSSPTTSLISLINQQSLEVDNLVRLHTDKLRSALDDARKRQCRGFLSAVAQHAQGRIAEKQAEVNAAEKRSAQLQDRLRQAAAEGQAWYNVARNSEVVIASLRDSLEQALMQNLNNGDSEDDKNNCGNKVVDSQLEEGYGDSEDVEAVTAVAGASAASAAGIPCPGKFTEVSKPANVAAAVGANLPATSTAAGICFSPCKSCGVLEGCVVVLPCRHLCLCLSCEPSTDECPVCHSRKNGSLPINLS